MRLKLSIDRQLCAGFDGGSSSSSPAPVDVSDDAQPPETPEQRKAKQLASRATALSTKLSATIKLKSKSEVESVWSEGCHTCSQLVHNATELPAHASKAWLFGLVQQAMQTGPLSFGKPAQFKRFARACEADGRVASDGEHPHIRSVRRVLEAVAPLLAPETEPAEDVALLFSTRQSAVLRGWMEEFARHCGGDVAAARRSGRGGQRLGGGDDEGGDAASSGGMGGSEASMSDGSAGATSDRERMLSALARRGL